MDQKTSEFVPFFNFSTFFFVFDSAVSVFGFPGETLEKDFAFRKKSPLLQSIPKTRMENTSLHSFLSGFIGFSSALSLLFVLGELPLAFKNRRNRTLLYLFVGVFIFQAHAYLLVSQQIRRYPHLYAIHLPVAVLFGPLLRSYISSLWEEEDSIPLFRWYDSVPFCGILLFLAPFYLSSAEEKLKCLETAQQGHFSWDLRIGIAGMSLTLLFYLAHIVWNLVHRVRWTTIWDKPELRMILSILFVAAASSFLGLSGSIQQISLSRLELSSALIAALLCGLYVIRQSHPEIFSAVKRIVEEEKKYKNTQLKSVDLNSLENKLNILFEEKKIYKEENLGLARLSEELGISPHQLSEYLNLHLKKNFFQLVNGYRIQEAKRLLLHSSETTVLSIAYEVGFQSKSSFNDSFRKEVGLSPTEFRKKTRSKT